MSSTGFPRAGFWIRVGAIVYDFLVILAVLMFAVGAALAFSVVLHKTGIWPLGDAIDHAARLQSSVIYKLYILTILIGFFALFWHKGGQTLGMKAWRLRVQNANGTRITWQQAFIRSLTAVVGLGNLWVLFSKDNLALQDMLAKCEVVRLTPEANQFKNWKTGLEEENETEKEA